MTSYLVVMMIWATSFAQPHASHRIAVERISQAPGLAAKYPGDRGIDKDPNVVFVENFEEPSLDTMKKRWETVESAEGMAYTADVPAGSGGKHSLRMTHVGGKGTGPHLYRRLQPGYDKLYARFYVKFDPDCFPIHHFG